LLARCILEPDAARARELAREYGQIVADVAQEAGIRRFEAAMALLDAASDALDRAANAAGEERRQLVGLAGTLITCAAARPSGSASFPDETP
jgi:hypothetical protein